MKEIVYNHRNAFFMGIMMLWHNWTREKVAEEIEKFDQTKFDDLDPLTAPHMLTAMEARNAVI